MVRRTFLGLVASAVLGIALVSGISAPPATADARVLATTLTYDDSLAAEFKTAVAQGVNVWNTSVANVRIVRAASGTRANIRVIADDGWPRANLGPVRPGGTVTVWMGRQAVQQGYNVIRIAAHELGHSLGLPDIKPGPCSSLMSGSTGGVSCTNAFPNSTERARVERNYSSGLVADERSGSGAVIVDAG